MRNVTKVTASFNQKSVSDEDGRARGERSLTRRATAVSRAPRERFLIARTDAVDARRVWCVRDHRLGQVHLRELRGEQQVLGRDRRTVLRRGIQQLLSTFAYRALQ